MSTDESMGLIMKGIEARPMKVGANLFKLAYLSYFLGVIANGSGSCLFLYHLKSLNIYSFKSTSLNGISSEASESESSSADYLEINFSANLTTYLIMLPGMRTDAKHCQIKQSNPVKKTCGETPPSFIYYM